MLWITSMIQVMTFKDVLDAIRPFVKILSKNSSLKNSASAKNRIEEMIKELEREITIEDLENIKL